MTAPEHCSTRTTASGAEEGERLSEIAEILAVGLTRLEARKSSRKSAETGESSLVTGINDRGRLKIGRASVYRVLEL